MMTDADRKIAERVGFLAHETIEEWTLRFFRERDMVTPTATELREILELGAIDELSAHQ